MFLSNKFTVMLLVAFSFFSHSDPLYIEGAAAVKNKDSKSVGVMNVHGALGTSPCRLATEKSTVIQSELDEKYIDLFFFDCGDGNYENIGPLLAVNSLSVNARNRVLYYELNHFFFKNGKNTLRFYLKKKTLSKGFTVKVFYE